MRRSLLISLILALVSLHVQAQSSGLGLYQSMKGLGLSYDFSHARGTGFDCLTVFADTGDMMLGRSDKAGIKFGFNRLYGFAGFQHPMALVSLYDGPGISAGRVRDIGHTDYGWCLSACGTFGCRIDFDRGVSIRAGFTAEVGAFIHKEKELHMSLYRNGLIHSAFPYIVISMAFGR